MCSWTTPPGHSDMAHSLQSLYSTHYDCTDIISFQTHVVGPPLPVSHMAHSLQSLYSTHYDCTDIISFQTRVVGPPLPVSHMAHSLQSLYSTHYDCTDTISLQTCAVIGRPLPVTVTACKHSKVHTVIVLTLSLS